MADHCNEIVIQQVVLYKHPVNLDLQIVVIKFGTRYGVQSSAETTIANMRASPSRPCQDGCVQGDSWEGDRL